MNLINQYRRRQKLPPLQLHAQASTVLRAHSQEMREANYFHLDSPQYGSLDYRLAYARVDSRTVHRFIAMDYTVSKLYQQLIQNPAFQTRAATHIALGLAEGEHPKYGNAIWATLVLLEQMTSISDLPREAKPGSTLEVQLQVRPGFSNPRMPITFPNGQVKTYSASKQTGSRYQFLIPLKSGPGRYTFEVLVDQAEQGPRVASILPVYVGQTYPLKEPKHAALENPKFENTAQAAAYLVQRVNQARQEHGLPPLKPNQQLALVAYAHSEDMARRKFFAHINPEGEDPNARFQKAGGKGQVGENIAYDLQIEDAHQHLMESPGHRANILHPDFTDIGIGVYYNGGHYYVTQLFQQRYQAVRPEQISSRLHTWLHQFRQKHKRSLLRRESLFNQAAKTQAQAMAHSDQLRYRVADMDFSDRYLYAGGKYRSMKTLILTAHSYEDALQKMRQYSSTLLDTRWTKYGLGVVRSDSNELGENTLWITVGLAQD